MYFASEAHISVANNFALDRIIEHRLKSGVVRNR